MMEVVLRMPGDRDNAWQGGCQSYCKLIPSHIIKTFKLSFGFFKKSKEIPKFLKNVASNTKTTVQSKCSYAYVLLLSYWYSFLILDESIIVWKILFESLLKLCDNLLLI